MLRCLRPFRLLNSLSFRARAFELMFRASGRYLFRSPYYRFTRLNRTSLVLNSDSIIIDVTPDTVITLTTGQILRVRETADEVVARIIGFRREVFGPDASPQHPRWIPPRRSRSRAVCRRPWQPDRLKAAEKRRAFTSRFFDGRGHRPVAGRHHRRADPQEKARFRTWRRGTAAMIVLGGTFGAVLVTSPMSRSCCARSADSARFLSSGQSDARRPSIP